MANISPADLQELGLAAAREVAGDAIQKVEVEEGDDWTGDPKFEFWYLVDTDRLERESNLGYVMARVRLRLIDELDRLGDDHGPFVHLIGRDGWTRRGGA